MTLAKPTAVRAVNAVLTHSTLPTLVFGCALTATEGTDVVDLRALDVPVSDLALRNIVRAAWRRAPLLTVRVDGAPSGQVLALLHGLVRRELRFGPAQLERFDERHRIVALTDAQAPSPALLALFIARVRAPSTDSTETGSAHAR